MVVPMVFVMLVGMRMGLRRVRMPMRMFRFSAVGVLVMIVMSVLMSMSDRRMGVGMAMLGHGLPPKKIVSWTMADESIVISPYS